MNFFSSVNGEFNESTTFEELKNNDSYKLSTNLEITGNTGDSIDASKYYRFYDVDGNAVQVVFKQGKTIVDGLIVSAVDEVYTVCYKVGETVYTTNYTVTIKTA